MRMLFWLSLAGGAALYLAMIFVTIPTLTGMAGGLMPFDMRPGGYDLTDATAYLDALGSAGRTYYLDHQLLLDRAFPGLMGLALILGALLFMRSPMLWVFVAVVLVAKTADYLENAAITRMLLADTLSQDMVAEASRWTLVKTVGDSIAYPVFLILAALALWRRLRGAGQ